MLGYQPFDELYERHIERPSAAYRSAIGPPVNLSPTAFEEFLARLKNFGEEYPNMAYWHIIDYKTLQITHSEGDLELFGRKLTSVKDFFKQIHPDYVVPYLRWRTAAYSLILNQHLVVTPFEAVFRVSLPLQMIDGSYSWFYMNSTSAQVDAEGRLVSNMQTFYREGKWSPHILRPLEASLQIRNLFDNALEKQLIAQLSLQMIDEFTDAELDLLTLYAADKTTHQVLEEKSWSRHTLHEYNANLLRKAKSLFVYEFRNAREFAGYCLEKGFIHLKT